MRTALFFAFLAVATRATAGGNLLDVTPAGASLIETDPGQVVTTLFRVTNRTSEQREVEAQLNLPANWRPITREFPLSLAAGASEIRIASFLVPETARAGRYQISMQATDRRVPAAAGSHDVEVIVLPVLKLSATLAAAPAIVLDGASYEAEFLVANSGNVAVEVFAKVRSAPDFAHVVSPAQFTLEPAGKARVTVTVETPGDLTAATRHMLEFFAGPGAGDQHQVTVSSLVEVLPMKTQAVDLFHRLSTELTTRYISGETDSSGMPLQFEWRGRGTLDEAGKHGVDFLFRGADSSGHSSLGDIDEYRFSYWTDRHRLRAGDQQYALSQLTEDGVNGRGTEISAQHGVFRVGAYGLETRRTTPVERQFAAYVDYSGFEAIDLGFNFLRADSITGLNTTLSLQGSFESLLPLTAVAVEFAASDGDVGQGFAHSIDLHGAYRDLNYNLRYIDAGAEYSGAYQDRNYLSLAFAYALNEALRVNADMRRDEQGPAISYVRPDERDLSWDLWANEQDRLIAELSGAILNERYALGALWRGDGGTSLVLEAESRRREDSGTNANASATREDTLELRAVRSMAKWFINVSAEGGRLVDEQNSSERPLQVYTASTIYRHKPSQVLTAYAQYRSRGGVDSGIDEDPGDRTLSAGVGGSFTLAAATNLDINYRLDQRFGATARRGHIVDASLRHQFVNGHRVALRARYRADAERQAAGVRVDYSIPLGVPVARKADVGAVSGRVVAVDTGAVVPGLILHAGGLVAVSGEDGSFTFPGLSVGTHTVTTDFRRVGIDHVVLSKAPLAVTVEPGRATRLEISVGKAANVTGILIIDSDTENDDPRQTVVDTQWTESKGSDANTVANVLLELRHGDASLRRLTDRWGRFEFDGVRPGRWTLSVLPSSLPSGLVADAESTDLQLIGGEERALEVRLIPQRRAIRMLQDGGVVRQHPQSRNGDGI